MHMFRQQLTIDNVEIVESKIINNKGLLYWIEAFKSNSDVMLLGKQF